ncbi:DNA double-strand break repair nuclease NurA [Candidatus Woesearchaeota archaeon]|nr:MAG: DNA double-strand break repair nuclease NurA [Candidatus Woesearchaeota archaeon]
MHNKIISHLLHFTEEPSFDDEADFSDTRYKGIPFSPANFHEISKPINSPKMVFIDGGNSHIINTPSLCVTFIRVYASIFKENRKTGSEKQEFYCVTKAVRSDNKLMFKTRIIRGKNNGEETEGMPFNLDDKTLRQGLNKVSITSVGEAYRKFLELSFATEIAKTLCKDDIIILDGPLQSKITNEEKFWKPLLAAAEQKNVILCGLCKTCELMTKKGNSLIASISHLAPKKIWYYHPVVSITNENHPAELILAKLHKNSKHTFRFEIFKKQKDKIGYVLSNLSMNSKDPLFLGYPYGLIDADKHARITSAEKNYLTMRLKSAQKKLEDNINALNAHDILNKIV